MPNAQLRVTDQDRDQVVEHVKAAFAEGRLDKFEMDERLDLAMTARTHADLMPIMTDLYGSSSDAPAPQAQSWHGNGPHARSWHADAPPADAGDRLGASAAHLLSLCGLFVIGPLIMLLTSGRTSPYVKRHATEALNFHLTVLGATLLLPFTIIGVILLPFIWILAFVLSVVGGAAALGDGGFRYPLTVRLIK